MTSVCKTTGVFICLCTLWPCTQPPAGGLRRRGQIKRARQVITCVITHQARKSCCFVLCVECVACSAKFFDPNLVLADRAFLIIVRNPSGLNSAFRDEFRFCAFIRVDETLEVTYRAAELFLMDWSPGLRILLKGVCSGIHRHPSSADSLVYAVYAVLRNKGAKNMVARPVKRGRLPLVFN